ncbi:MAG: sigma-54-dependent Fis family transcriptional regulator [Nitrospirales bacterium]|nr:MAG: sigma-54-dependent Fis family transcriptional regulator [Nitrospirales bacterium]
MLRALDYEVRLLTSAEWLKAPQPNLPSVSILCFGSHFLLPQEQILERLLQDYESAWLGVFTPNDSEWNSEILKHCDEFVSWPCHEQEFRLRLEKLVLQQNGGVTGNHEGGGHEFAKLNLVGRSPAFLRNLAFAQKIGQWDAPVLIHGETGTGKELFARALHYLGSRRAFPFVPVNCGAIPDTLLENELFGHERGAFTDAYDKQPGLVNQAHHGTLFLDEVDTLSSKAQVALLRFLQDQVYSPLGGKQSCRVNVRIIAASNVNLLSLVEKQKFRRDLFYRLDVLPLHLPPLRERKEDIPILVDHFLRQFSVRYNIGAKVLHPRVLTWMTQYAWPGNVRELENILHRNFLISDSVVIHRFINVQTYDACLSHCSDPATNVLDLQFTQAKAHVVEDFEKSYLIELLRTMDGNITQAAKRAGKERRTLGKLLKKHGIARKDYLPHH